MSAIRASILQTSGQIEPAMGSGIRKTTIAEAQQMAPVNTTSRLLWDERLRTLRRYLNPSWVKSILLSLMHKKPR
jgi:hypothetical protein